MSTPKIASPIDYASAERLADGGRLGAFTLGFQGVYRNHVVRGPDYVKAGERPSSTVTDMAEFRSRRQPQAEVVDVGTTELETSPATVDGEGKVVDITQHRMAQEARAMADAEYAKMPSTLNQELRQ